MQIGPAHDSWFNTAATQCMYFIVYPGWPDPEQRLVYSSPC